MAIIIGYPIGDELCQALGIDSHNVKSLTIHVTPDEPITVDVKRFLEEDQVKAMIDGLMQAKNKGVVTINEEVIPLANDVQQSNNQSNDTGRSKWY